MKIGPFCYNTIVYKQLEFINKNAKKDSHKK